MSQKKINAFLELLINAKVGNQVYSFNHVDNPYAKGENSNQYRNLKQYLTQMHAMKPTVLLVGEAPGYNGCKLTGIPFTSERVMSENDFFKDYSVNRDTNNKIRTEATATKVWPVFDKLRVLNKMPLLWNIFPYHPHEKGNPEKSNRAPLKDEINFGFDVLKHLLEMFESIDTVYAVGHKAEAKINSETSVIEILNKRRKKSGKVNHSENIYIKHPSYGGKEKFKKDIEEYLH
ncbi:MAG: uracil-DNA glycosylase [Chitinophagaceae bacterium]